MAERARVMLRRDARILVMKSLLLAFQRGIEEWTQEISTVRTHHLSFGFLE
jgi:hypothetical protein